MLLAWMRNLFTLGCLSVVLSACAWVPADPDNSPLYQIPTGTTIILHSDISIPAERATVYIQNGKVMDELKTDRYYPYCKFEMYTLKPEDRVVRPDTFVVQRSTTEEYTLNQERGYRLVKVGSASDGGITFLEMNRVMYIRSAQQPDVYRLTCGIWATPPDFDHITLDQMRQTLAPLISVYLPGQAPLPIPGKISHI